MAKETNTSSNGDISSGATGIVFFLAAMIIDCVVKFFGGTTSEPFTFNWFLIRFLAVVGGIGIVTELVCSMACTASKCSDWFADREEKRKKQQNK